MLSSRVADFSRNRFKLGLFGSNCSSGRAATRVPERWSGSWADNLRLAQMADVAGIDFLLPIGRWKGYGGATNFEGATLETTAWACGLLAATKKITVFSTVHAPLVHPVFAAKQFVTADQIGEGRFGLNVVCGWNEDEFAMFGVEQREHDDRYEYGGEWLRAVYRMWEESGSFDVHGEFFDLTAVEAEPKPFGGTRPLVMNAGSSSAGRTFGARYCDVLFRHCRTLELGATEVRETTAEARALGRDVGVFTPGFVICRPTQGEAEEYRRYVIDENADWDAIDYHMGMSMRNNHSLKDASAEEIALVRKRYAAGHGGYPMVGNPDFVASEMQKMSAAGFAGFAFSFVNYNDEFPFFRDEVLPRLERLGLRESAGGQVHATA
jgi:alkanesulfonate monooxygenase SsuD/methylene tetrahydromethanopterin reductase-like flavin-dependent oxidoreductase (luciferase family)